MRELVLPVECFHQRSPDTCLAACVRMVLQYHGSRIDELKFYHEARFGRQYPGLCDVCIAWPLIKRGYKVTSYWNGHLDDWGVWTTDLAELYKEHEKKALKTKKYFRKINASVPLIKNFLKKGKPVIAEVIAGKFYNTREIGTHMITICGFNKHGFWMCDPWGMQHFITFEHFKKAWIPSRHFGRSMIVIEPISTSLSRLRRGV